MASSRHLLGALKLRLGSLATNVFRFKQANLVQSGAEGAVTQERPNAALKAESLYCGFSKIIEYLVDGVGGALVWKVFSQLHFFQEELYPPIYIYTPFFG